MPPMLRRCWLSWQRHHPGWDFRLYADADCRDFVATEFPELLDLYDAFPRPVLRYDLVRYLIVYRRGGVYSDMDMLCYRSIDPLLGGHRCLLTVEFQVTRARQRRHGFAGNRQLGNAIFAAVAGHPFLGRLIERVRQRARMPISSDEDVEDVTGPRMLTREYYALSDEERADVSVLRQIHLMPPVEFPFLFPLNINMYARHLSVGGWRTRRLRHSLKESLIRWKPSPNPFRSGCIPPEEFVQGRT